MEKEFIPYEQALALKRLGYNEKGLAFYTENAYGDGQELQFFRKPNDCNNDYVFISAPTFSQAFRWFREKYNLYGFCYQPNETKYWGYSLENKAKYDTYEEAELECLKKLIEIVKEKQDMTPKEKAVELVDKYYIELKEHKGYYDTETAKQCALIAVDLHLEELSKMKLIFSDRELHYKHWQEVKKEIEKL